MMAPTGFRGPLRQVYDILINTRKPIKKTHLMYATGLNLTSLLKYLPSLLEKALVEKVPYIPPRARTPDKRTPYLYMLTEEGEALLKLYNQIYYILSV